MLWNYKPANGVKNNFKLGLRFSNKGATYIRGFAINLRHRSTRLKVGVRPIIEMRPMLGNLRYMEERTWINVV